jgi:hypothetical protein
MRNLTGAVCAALLALAATAQAGPIKPPGNALRGNGVMLVSGTVVAANADARLRLDDVALIHGKADVPKGTIELRTEPWVPSRLVAGERVIVAYATLTRDPMMGERMIPDPDGPRQVVVSGLEPALFADTPLTRARLLDADGVPRGASFDEALAGLADPDPRWQYYYVAELLHRPALAESLTRRHRGALGRVLASVDAHPAARTLILDASARIDLGADWWQRAALDIVASSPLTAIDRADWPQATLVLAAFDRLRLADVAVPTDHAARWLRSDVPALAEAALLAVRRSDPSRERALAEAAAAEALLPIHTRRFIQDHLRRLAAMEAALVHSDR